MHTSHFQYPITRPYPFRWFTPLILIGGVLAATWLSVLNYAGNAYLLKSQFTSDPAELESHTIWTQRAPWSWTNKMKPECQPTAMNIGSQVFTNNLGMTYTIERVWTESGQAGTSIQILPALSYKQGQLNNCDVKKIQVEFRRTDDTVDGGGWWTWSDTQAVVTSTCDIGTPSGTVKVNITTTQTAHIDNFDYYIDRDPQSVPSLWWGSRMVSCYYYIMTRSLSLQKPYEDDRDYKYDSVSITLTKHPAGSVWDRSYFDIKFVVQQTDALRPNEPAANMRAFYNQGQRNVTLHYANGDVSTRYPDIANDVEGFGMALSSHIMLDLGQRGDSSNVLINETLLRRYIFDSSNDHANYAAWWTVPDFPAEGNVTWDEAWDKAPERLRQLGDDASFNTTFFSQYTCTVPVTKDPLSIIVSVLVADLVFLSALWKIACFGATWLVQRKYPAAMACKECYGVGTFDMTVPLRNEDDLPRSYSKPPQQNSVEETASDRSRSPQQNSIGILRGE